MGKMGRATIHNECKQEGGELKCRRYKQNADGTQVTLATSSKRVDAQCKEVTTHMGGEEKELDRLNGFMDGKLSVKCQKAKEADTAVPDDY